MGQAAVRSVLNELKKDGWLKDIGVIPQQKQAVNQQANTQRPMTDVEEERAVQELTARIVRGSIERCKVFNMRMPQLEQLEGEEEDDEKDRRPLLERKGD